MSDFRKSKLTSNHSRQQHISEIKVTMEEDRVFGKNASLPYGPPVNAETILNDTSNATDRVFAMISKLLKILI